MATCKFIRGGSLICDQTATTTLKKHDGETVQLCEYHAALLIRLAKATEADHWLVLNKIPA